MIDTVYKTFFVEETKDGKYEGKISEKNIQDLPEGDVLVRVLYSSLNYKDALSTIGNKGVTRNYPHTPGIDAAGIVEVSTDSNIKVGQEVIVGGHDFGMNTWGGFGQYVRVPAGWIIPLPEGMPLEKSMMYGTAGFTAGLSVYKMISNGVKSEVGPVLVTGASGGVGSVAVGILSKLGYKVCAGSGKPEAQEMLRKLGAKEILSRSELNDESGKLMLKSRWAGVVDAVGGNILSTAIKSTMYGGTLTTCGNVASPDFNANVYPFILRGVSLLGIDAVQCPEALRFKIWDLLAKEWDIVQLEETVKKIGLSDLGNEIDNMLAGNSLGRTVVNINA